MLTERIATNSWYTRTVQQHFAETCRLRADRPAVHFEGETISYGDLKQRADRVSAVLLDLGVGPGDVVAVLPSPTPEFVDVYFGVLQTGAIFNALNLLWGTPEFAGVIARNNPTVIITVDEHAGRNYAAVLREAIEGLSLQDGAASADGVPRLRHVLAVPRHGAVPEGFGDLAALCRAATVDDDRIGRLVEASMVQDVQWICQTSGTTGLSKSGLWNHRSPQATANFQARYLGLTEDDVCINLSPFFHNSGICTALTMAMAYCGIPVVLMERFEPVTALQLAATYRATCTFGFDAHWQGMYRSGAFDRDRFHICKAIFAGEPKTYDLVKSMCPDGAVLANLYAQTENGPLVSFADFACVDERIMKYTNGRPLPGVEVVIKDIDTAERVPQGVAGEICYRSPFMFTGYYKQDDAYAAAFDEEGWLHSGEFGSFDGGYVTFLGRLGGVVKSGGENVSTLKVSALLLERFADEFEDVQTLGIDDDYWGSKVVTFVRTKPGVTLRGTRHLRADCKGAMADYEVPREFLPWEGDWPVSAEGKLDVRVLRAKAAE